MTYSHIKNAGDIRKITYFRCYYDFKGYICIGFKIEGSKNNNCLFKKDSREVLFDTSIENETSSSREDHLADDERIVGFTSEVPPDRLAWHIDFRFIIAK